MKIFHFTFPGACLGGKAVVIAEDEKAAKQALIKRMKKDTFAQYDTVDFKNITLRMHSDVPNEAEVTYYDNGDY